MKMRKTNEKKYLKTNNNIFFIKKKKRLKECTCVNMYVRLCEKYQNNGSNLDRGRVKDSEI